MKPSDFADWPIWPVWQLAETKDEEIGRRFLSWTCRLDGACYWVRLEELRPKHGNWRRCVISLAFRVREIGCEQTNGDWRCWRLLDERTLHRSRRHPERVESRIEQALAAWRNRLPSYHALEKL